MDSIPQISNEIEIKLVLKSFPDYLKLIGFLGRVEDEEHHTNAFYDTKDQHITKAGWALRVRVENKRGLVTMKSFPTKQGTAVIRKEIESEIEKSAAIDILNERETITDLNITPIDFLKKNIKLADDLKLIVKFDNVRQKKQFRLGDYIYTFEIDKTSYEDGTTDYELEIELDDIEHLEKVEDNLRKIFASLQIDYMHQKYSKLERALNKAGIA